VLGWRAEPGAEFHGVPPGAGASSVDINGIADLERLASENGRFAIGAGVRYWRLHCPVAGPLGDLPRR
jgi:hypothetical protein